jgi:glycosidase
VRDAMTRTIDAVIDVVPTGRLAPGSEAGELEVHVAAGDAERVLDDGTVITVRADEVRITGPRRDVLVVVGGRPVQRAHGTDVSVDLWAARHAVPYDPAGIEADAARDRLRLPRHDDDIEPRVPKPGEAARVRVATGGDVVGGTARYTLDGSDPWGPTAARVPLDAAGPDATWQAVLPGQPDDTWVRYGVELELGDGTVDAVADAAPAFVVPLPTVPFLRPARRRFGYVVHEPTVPSWVTDAVVYHVLVDRFAADGGRPVRCDGPPPLLGFLGGTIDGLVSRLDHIVALGATAILVSCLTPSDMHVGYDARASTGVDPRFGTVDDVRRLCREAHARGVRVLLDHEASYAGGRHPAVVAARHDPTSPTARWFLRDPDSGRLLGWYGGNPTFVPFDHDVAEVREHLLDAARWWLDLGIDGFRLDSAHAASTDFWAAFGRAVRTVRPDALTFGEVTSTLDDAQRLRGRLGGFHDFWLERALRGFAADGSVRASELDEVLSERDALPDDVARLTFVECHDDDRFSHLAGRDDRRRLLLALGLLLTLPGTPLLSYGTEVGLGQPSAGDPDLVARLPMPWDGAQDSGLLAEVAALVHRRLGSVALRRGDRETLLVDDGRGLLAFARTHPEQRIVVVANAGAAVSNLDVPGFGRVDVDALSLLVTEVTR